MTNREVHEEAAGMNLDNRFFELNNIDPDAEYTRNEVENCINAETENY